MRIISSFKDYYDSASAFGVDTTTTYIREEVEKSSQGSDNFLKNLIQEKDFRKPSPLSSHLHYGFRSKINKIYYNLETFYIGFCGQIYPCFRVSFQPEPITRDGIIISTPKLDCKFYYDKDKLLDFVKSHKSDQVKQYPTLNMCLEEMSDFYTKVPNELLQIFRLYKVPIFTFKLDSQKYGRWATAAILTLNPCLSKYNFGQVKMAVQAFQEIHGYISGILGQEANPMVETSDEVRAASHGHDGKYSFRKPPGTKKGKPQWR